MAFGTADRLKSDVAEGVALVVGRLACAAPGASALMTFGAGRAAAAAAARVARPGVVALRRALARGRRRRRRARPGRAGRRAGPRRARRAPARAWSSSSPTSASSDDWARALGALRARHAVLAVEVRDPREATLPPVGRIARRRPRDRAARRGRHLAAARARALRGAGARAARDAGARAAPPARRPRRAVDRRATGCCSWAGGCGDAARARLRLAARAAGAAGDPAGAAGAATPRAAAGTAYAVRFPAAASLALAARRRPAVAPPPARRAGARGARRAGARAGQAAATVAVPGRAARRSCWSPTTPGRCRPPTSSPTG